MEVGDGEVACGAVRADQAGPAGRGSSIRELAVRHHVHRRTVRQALASAVPPPRKAYPPRPRPAIGPYAAVIDEWLLADRDVPRKQRHTARRVWQRLVAEHGASAGRGDGVAVCGPPPRRAGPGQGPGHGAAGASAGRGGRGGLRRVPRRDRRGAAQAVDVRDAAVVLGPGVPRRVRHPGAGSVPGRPRAGVRVLRRGARPGPVRQPQARGGAGAARPGPGRVRAVHRAALPLRVRLVLLRPGQGRRARERRGGRRDRPVPPPPPGPRPRRRVAGRAEPADRRRRHDRRRPGDHRPAGHDRRGVRRRAARHAAAARPSRSTRPGCCRPGWMAGPGSACGRTTTPSRPAMPAAACRCGCPPPPSRCSTGRRSWPGTSAPPGKYAEILALDHYLEVLRLQARRAARRHRAGPGPGRRRLHRRPPAVLGRRPPPARRRRRDPGADRGPARAPHPARRSPDRRDDQGDRAPASSTPRPSSSTPAATRAGRSRRSSRSARWPATTAPPPPWTPTTSC